MVGCGMGRTYNNEPTFARAANHLGFNGAAIDTLRRIFLAAGHDDVATQAMRDCVPHGMRGQSCYLTISVLAKPTGQPH